MAKAFQEISLTEANENNAFHVVPLSGGKPLVRMLPAADRLYYTHTLNTYENKSGIVIDLATAPINPFSRNLTIAALTDKAVRDNDHSALMLVRRFHLPWSESTPITSENLSDPKMATDFTRIDPLYNGKQHCFYWGVHWKTDGSSYASMAIGKHDLCSDVPVKMWSRKNWYPSEPTFIPSREAGSAEDAGVLVF